LDSLLRQTHRNFELIINDDCSSDVTPDVAWAYERCDSRVRYYRNPTNVRYAANQNAAVSRATADLVAFVHDGDVYREDCVARWVDVMCAHPNVGIVFNASDSLDADGNVAMQHRHPYPEVIPGK